MVEGSAPTSQQEFERPKAVMHKVAKSGGVVPDSLRMSLIPLRQ
jgi:hypothetical protein